VKYLRVTITDTLSFWDDYLGDYVFNPENAKTFTNWYRLPDDWLPAGALAAERREQILGHLYGADWWQGNGDGSKYVVLKIDEHVLSDAQRAERAWAKTNDTCYAAGDGGQFERISPEAM
jgi:hypothetical protein